MILRSVSVLCLSALVWSGFAQPALAAPGDDTEKLLKEKKFDYTKVKDGVFRLVVETKQGSSVVMIEEKKTAWKDSKGNDVLYIYVYSEILVTPAKFKPSLAMLTKLADWNDRIMFGSLGLAKNKDDSYSLFRNGTIFLKNLDAEQLEDMVLLTHTGKFHFQKEFLPFLED